MVAIKPCSILFEILDTFVDAGRHPPIHLEIIIK